MVAALCIWFLSLARSSQQFYARELTFPQKLREQQIVAQKA